MAASSRRSDYGEEFVERLRRDRFRKEKYILVNGVSSEEEDEELCFDEEDDEIASYAMDPPPRPSSTHSSRRPPSIAASYSKRNVPRVGGAYGFDAQDLYYFGVLSELTDKFTPEKVARLIGRNPPPSDYRSLVSIERIAYLLYYSLYGRYLSVNKFHHVFNREFYKYTSTGDSERVAFLKICRHTLEEYRRRALEQNKQAYKLSQKHLFSNERETPDSRLSDRPSMEESEDLNSVDSLAKELMFYRSPHTPVRFGPGGRIIFMNPDSGVSTVCIEDVKHFYKDAASRRYVEMLESFKGPMLVGHTPPQTPLLFIQCQIDRILQSDVYRANPASGDANDCLLIWCLLEMLIRQHGKVTGPDLARLLCSNQPYPNLSAQNFLKPISAGVRGRADVVLSRQDSNNDHEPSRDAVDPAALDRVTRFLLGGHIDEAIESAISDGLLFDALLLAHRLFRDDRRRLETIEARLMGHRSPQHPVTTLLSVAAEQPVPLLSNPTSYDTNGWRSHIAIVLANLHSTTAMNAVFHLGLALAQKEFNSAADFCFLAVNLLTGYDCFQQQNETNASGQPHRNFVRLINASLPDDEAHSCATRFGWQILDYQATELYDFALRLANPHNPTNALSNSACYRNARQQYAQLLDELGGFTYSVELYRAGGIYFEERSTTKTPTMPFAAKSSAEHSTAKMPTPSLHSSAINPPLAASMPSQTLDKPQQQPQSHPTPNHYHHQPQPNQVANKASRSRTPSPTATLTHSPPIASSNTMTMPGRSFSAESESTGDDDEEEVDDSGDAGGMVVAHEMDFQHMQSNLPSFPPLPPFFNPNPAPPPQQNAPNNPSMAVPDVQQQPLMMEGVKAEGPRRNSNVPSMAAAPVANFQPPAQPVMGGVETDGQRKDSAASMSLPSKNVPVQPKKATDAKNEKKSEVKAKGGGFLSGFLSKIKPPAAPNSKEMRLPEDKDPKIVWDAQLGRYVDQDQQNQPQEELGPPPIIPLQPTAGQDRNAFSASPPTVVAQQPQQQQPLTFPQLPTTSQPAVAPTPAANRPFQGRARYANAWAS